MNYKIWTLIMYCYGYSYVLYCLVFTKNWIGSDKINCNLEVNFQRCFNNTVNKQKCIIRYVAFDFVFNFDISFCLKTCLFLVMLNKFLNALSHTFKMRLARFFYGFNFCHRMTTLYWVFLWCNTEWKCQK